ncbi:ATP-binding cassette domain-containing protein [Paenibacillus chitinolyticus]|uniref:ATP-binding cassette domain-containing protein n=1 Tax=Paenibacillus chitinolyticus TaxID=79263 RepID=UPI00365ED855
MVPVGERPVDIPLIRMQKNGKDPQGYDTFLDDRKTSLSGGERRRLILARALVRNTDVLILDESTSQLDQIFTYRKGKITIIITHRLPAIINANIIYVMNEGKILDYGTHSQLLDQCSYYKGLFNAVLHGEIS